MNDSNIKFHTHSGTAAALAVTGRCRLFGFGVGSKYTPTNAYGEVIDYQGRVILKDSTDASGDALLQIPIVATEDFPARTFTNFADEDGYVLFENGIYIDESTESGKGDPLDGFTVYLIYG